MYLVLFTTILLLTVGSDRVLSKRIGGPSKRILKYDNEVETRIVGGSQVGLADGYDFFVQWVCGGVLIHPDIVMTAAHCLTDIANLNYPLFVGGRNLFQGIKRTIYSGKDNYRLHPSYQPQHPGNPYDFMLLKLNEPIWDITPAVINANSSLPFSGDQLTTMGYGSTSEGGPGSNTLQKVDVIYFNNCAQRFPVYANRVEDESMLCAGTPTGGKDACYGDSGGPIVDAKGTVMGLVSWGFGCAHATQPGVYSRVSAGANWIQNTLCDLSAFPPQYCLSNRSPTGLVSLRVDIQYDNMPIDTAWIITDQLTGAKVYSMQRGLPGYRGQWIPQVVSGLKHGNYMFEIFDKSYDGISGGYIQIHQLASDGTSLVKLADLPGEFGAYQAIEISI